MNDDRTMELPEPPKPSGPPRKGAPDYYPPSPAWGENAKLLVVAMCFFLAVVGVYLIRNVLAIAALAALIAFLVAPLIRLAHRRLHIPRGLALLIAYLIVFIGTLAFGYLVVNEVVKSIQELDPVGTLNDARVWLLGEIDADNYFRIFGLTIDMTGLMHLLRDPVAGSGDAGIVIDANTIVDILGRSLDSVRTIAGIITAVITSAILTTLVAMYLNADSVRMHDALARNIPAGYERDGLMMMRKQHRVWTGYLYGQLINSIITGTIVFAVLWFFGLPGAFLMGAIMVVLNMIPTFGPILAAIPGVLAALITGSTRWPELQNWWFALIVVAIYLVVVQLQANIIAPRVMGTAVQLRPAVILIGLLVGFQVGGLLGSLLAVPIIASIRDVAVYIWKKLTDRDPFADEKPIPIPVDP
ncbi:MAG: AI-2E family transporter [Acidimicrobiia bacterium]|nr:AI-2E family transporter [Acidimicrobiia bacterium]